MQALTDNFYAWLFRWPFIRRVVFKLWRLQLRIERATLATAVVVVRSDDGHVLVVSDPSGMFQLPSTSLDGWITITHQVEDWLKELLQRAATASLVSVAGTCGDVTFLYRAEIDTGPVMHQAARWLSPDIAAVSLTNEHARLFSLCIRD